VPGPIVTPPIAPPPERLILRALVHDHIRPAHHAHRGHIHEHHDCCREPDCFDKCFPPAPYWKYLEYNNLEFRGCVAGRLDFPPPEPAPVQIVESEARVEPRSSAVSSPEWRPPPLAPDPGHPPAPAPATNLRPTPAARFRLPPAPITGRLIDLFI
jgi:hypothetical protein